jgi:ribonuclease J
VDVVQDVPSGRLFLDGDQLIATDHQAIHERQKLSENGLVVLTVVQEEEGVLALPIQVMFRGLVTYQECMDRVHEAAMDTYTQVNAQGKGSDQKLRERLQRATQYTLKQLIGKRPEVMVSIMEA